MHSAAKKGRPTSLPDPWRSLAAKVGGVGALAQALGTVPRTVHDWAFGHRIPRGPSWLLVQRVFREAGLEAPPRGAHERRGGVNPRRYLDEITVGIFEFQSARDFLDDGGPEHQAHFRVANALAKIEAAAIAFERAAYGAFLGLADVEGSGLGEARKRCEDLHNALEGPLEVLVGQLSLKKGPNDPRLGQTLKSLEYRRAEALGALREAFRNLERLEAAR